LAQIASGEHRVGRRQLTIRVETEEDLALGTTYTLTLNEIAVYDLPAPSQAKLPAAERDDFRRTSSGSICLT